MASVFEADSEAERLKKDATKKVKEADEKTELKKRREWQRDVELGVNPLQQAESTKEKLAEQFKTAAKIEQDKLGKDALSDEAAKKMDQAAFEAETQAEIDRIAANGLEPQSYPEKASLAGLPTTYYNEQETKPQISDTTSRVHDELSRNLISYREEQNLIDLGKLGYSAYGVSPQAQALIDEADKQAGIALQSIRGYNLKVTAAQQAQARDVLRDFQRSVESTIERDLTSQRQQQLNRFAPGARVEPGQETAHDKTTRETLEREERERTRKLAEQLSRAAKEKLVSQQADPKNIQTTLGATIATQQAVNESVEAKKQLDLTRSQSIADLQKQLHASGPNVGQASAAHELLRQQRKDEQRLEEEKRRTEHELGYGPGSNDPNDRSIGGGGDGGNGVGIEEDPLDPNHVGEVNIQVYAADATGRAINDHSTLQGLGADGKVAADNLGMSSGPSATTLDGVENNGEIQAPGIEPMYLQLEPAHYDPNKQ